MKIPSITIANEITKFIRPKILASFLYVSYELELFSKSLFTLGPIIKSCKVDNPIRKINKIIFIYKKIFFNSIQLDGMTRRCKYLFSYKRKNPEINKVKKI